jgi:hypothetical protein
MTKLVVVGGIIIASSIAFAADNRPPKYLFGIYARTDPACFIRPADEKRDTEARAGDSSSPCGEDYEQDGYFTSTITLSRVKGPQVRVIADLYFANGHSCDLNAIGTWDGQKVIVEVVVPDRPKPNVCRIEFFFESDLLQTSSDSPACQAFCGSRGGFNDIELKKAKRHAR